MLDLMDDNINSDQVKFGSKLKRPKDSDIYLDSH